jgi:hypothetical protein
VNKIRGSVQLNEVGLKETKRRCPKMKKRRLLLTFMVAVLIGAVAQIAYHSMVVEAVVRLARFRVLSEAALFHANQVNRQHVVALMVLPPVRACERLNSNLFVRK